jgi:hypothetical protein
MAMKNAENGKFNVFEFLLFSSQNLQHFYSLQKKARNLSCDLQKTWILNNFPKKKNLKIV